MYELIRSNRKTLQLEVKTDGRVIVRAPLFMSKRKIEEFVESRREWIGRSLEKAAKNEAAAGSVEKLSEAELKALVKQAKQVIPERVAYFAPLVGVNYGSISIKHQHTRWGSCSAKGNLNFNCLLMLTPPEVIDSVVVHELCHRKHMNHSQRFYDEVYRVYPNYDACHRWLKKNGSLIMRRNPQ